MHMRVICNYSGRVRLAPEVGPPVSPYAPSRPSFDRPALPVRCLADQPSAPPAANLAEKPRSRTTPHATEACLGLA